MKTLTDKISPCQRITLAESSEDRLYFAQVREDPLLELKVLAPNAQGRYAVVSSGGCTALSLLSHGAGHVAAIDLNRSQNHLVELKSVALRALPASEARAFLGASLSDSQVRVQQYSAIRSALTEAARLYWDGRTGLIGKGVLGCGVTEKFLRGIVMAVRIFIHPRSRLNRLLALSNLKDQESFFDKEWNTFRWRFLFVLLLNRRVFNRTYHPAFFQNVENPSFSNHFRNLVERALKNLPVKTNYFLHYMIKGKYADDVPGGLPPYLENQGAQAAGNSNGLLLVDGTFTAYLRTLDANSLDGFSLSNIGEWHDANQLETLFGEILRTAKPGATLCFRNFVGWTDIPARYAHHFPLDPAADAMIAQDRSMMQSRFAFSRIIKEKK